MNVSAFSSDSVSGPAGSTIALIGDRSDSVVAHRAIERSLDSLNAPWRWIASADLAAVNASTHLASAAGVWCVPGSPYASTAGALAAIRFARELGLPFLGTCGGFQHALLECARDLCATPHAAHAEIDPSATDPVCVPLTCQLREALGAVTFVPGSRLASLLGPRCDDVGYNCGFSLSPTWQPRLEAVGLRFTGHDAVNGDIRAVELPHHPFFIGTLFQPERAILCGSVHPLVDAFVHACFSAK
jgi:CTP synthase (UTP-ammonia lyase)